MGEGKDEVIGSIALQDIPLKAARGSCRRVRRRLLESITSMSHSSIWLSRLFREMQGDFEGVEGVNGAKVGEA